MDVMKKLSSLQEISKSQLSKILCVNPNKKYLILEPSLIKPLERVCGVKWLKSFGVDKIFKTENVIPNFSAAAIFYMIYSETRTFKQVVDQIRSQIDIEKPPRNKFHIIVVPQALCTFENELEELGLLYTAIALHSFQWMPIHLDVGVLSLEIPNVFSSLFVYQNALFLSNLSKILWQLCFVIGKPRFMLALGQYSVALLNQYDRLCEDRGETDKLDSDFGAFVIVDRNVDYPSALLTPGTYSGLLNEVYTCRTGVCENKEEVVDKLDEKCNPVVAKQVVSFALDSNQDSVYADIKNRYFTEVTSVLSNLTKQLKSEKVSSKEMALDEIKHYVQTKLQATKSRKKFITNHLLAAESIINILGHRYENQNHIEQNIMKDTEKTNSLNFLDELLATENDKYATLRLFCLLAVTQKLTESEVRTFWHKYLQQFGFANGYGFLNLVKAGFISEPVQSSNSLNLQSKIKIPKFTSSDFYINAKNLKQIPPDPDKINLKYPTCASYVYGGAYIPLITQIAGMILNSLPVDDVRSKLDPLGALSVRNDKGYPLQTRSVLIYVVGGVTYAEIAACNLLETLTGARICVLSDRIVTGNDLMASVVDFPN
ncbi:vacuolar protein sorting-associated protein 33B [Anoplophora glabripennis]|uniref:vacuolar protein sorting-associated protein 33B n=1 Tax=Anoplophora glabripennis TaxID=217634 RepID=UPI0008740A69|nr:vacuolar protein sorting-associated protein 33B [Anoplophora glabripennis]